MVRVRTSGLVVGKFEGANEQDKIHAREWLSWENDAIQNVASMRALNGSEQSRLGFASTLLTNNQTNLQSAISNISDVDVAQESTNYAKYNILVQTGTAMLAQANALPQTVLKLLS